MWSLHPIHQQIIPTIKKYTSAMGKISSLKSSFILIKLEQFPPVFGNGRIRIPINHNNLFFGIVFCHTLQLCFRLRIHMAFYLVKNTTPILLNDSKIRQICSSPKLNFLKNKELGFVFPTLYILPRSEPIKIECIICFGFAPKIQSLSVNIIPSALHVLVVHSYILPLPSKVFFSMSDQFLSTLMF